MDDEDNDGILPDVFDEDLEDECPDLTVPQAHDLTLQDSRCDARGIAGWEAVDALAGYLVGLNRTITALSNGEVAEILRLYAFLNFFDQTPTRYTLKTKITTLPGPWRASRKRNGSDPGQQAAERLFMVHGQAAHRPDHNRVSECVALKLLRLVEDSREIMDRSDLVLVTMNTTTVSCWWGTYYPARCCFLWKQLYGELVLYLPATPNTLPELDFFSSGTPGTLPGVLLCPSATPSSHSRLVHLPGTPCTLPCLVFHPTTTLSIQPGLVCHPPTTLSIHPGLACHPTATLSILPGLAFHPTATLSILPGLACNPPTTLSLLPGLVIHLLLS
ncbi:unnamed protein product [Arctogadus glacialis]